MAVKVNIASSGIVGVNGLTSAETTQASTQVPRNSVVALTGSAAYTLNLPVPQVGDDFEGSVIYVKNLVDFDPASPLDGDGNPTRTFQVDFEPGIVPIESDPDFVPFTFTRNQTFSFFYINPTIGWLIRM